MSVSALPRSIACKSAADSLSPARPFTVLQEFNVIPLRSFVATGNVTFAEQDHYKEGTLIIDLVDRRTRKIVWRGFGVGEVHNNPQKNIDDLPKVVDGVLAQLKLSPDEMRVRRGRPR